VRRRRRRRRRMVPDACDTLEGKGVAFGGDPRVGVLDDAFLRHLDGIKAEDAKGKHDGIIVTVERGRGRVLIEKLAAKGFERRNALDDMKLFGLSLL